MSACEQMSGLSVLEHGESVHQYYLDLKDHVINGQEIRFEWKLPEWVYNESLWEMLEKEEVLKRYQIYHDCGKPYCIEFDEEGRRHFPGHERASFKTWLAAGGELVEAELMLHDMDIHRMKSKDFESFKTLDIAPSLLVTGLAEIHSNAVMFGGINSTSFKIKWKNINKFGRRYIEQVVNAGAAKEVANA